MSPRWRVISRGIARSIMRRISRASGKLILLCTIDFAEFEMRGGSLFANRARNAFGVSFIGSSRRYKRAGGGGRGERGARYVSAY